MALSLSCHSQSKACLTGWHNSCSLTGGSRRRHSAHSPSAPEPRQTLLCLVGGLANVPTPFPWPRST